MGLRKLALTFIPLGTDIDASVYKAQTPDQSSYFVKLKHGHYHDVVAIEQLLLELMRSLLSTDWPEPIMILNTVVNEIQKADMREKSSVEIALELCMRHFSTKINDLEQE